MTGPEQRMMEIFECYGIRYTKPDSQRGVPQAKGRGQLDFYLPDYDLWVEVKTWSCERLHKQLRSSGKERDGILVVIGMDGVEKFGALLKGCK